MVGGLTGQGSTATTPITNSYWNIESSPNAIGLTNQINPGNFSQGLTKTQFDDIAYYTNHTIVSVLNTRAEAAAAVRFEAAQAAARQQEAKQAAFESDATSLGGQTSGQSLQQGGSQQQTVQQGSNPSGQRQQPSLEGNIVFTGNYSAHIKSINVDGVGYELEDDSNKK